jgi:hypothetical protein
MGNPSRLFRVQRGVGKLKQSKSADADPNRRANDA